MLSVDGRTWTPGVTTPLLDPDLVWVPGDVASGTLYARNASREQATGFVTIHLDGGPDGVGDSLVDELDVRVRTGSGRWTDGRRARVTGLGPGEVLPIDIEVGFDPAATNATQLRTAQLDIVVFLTAAGQDAGAPPGSEEPGSLPRTGVNLLVPTMVALAAVLLGSVLLRLRERRERRSVHG